MLLAQPAFSKDDSVDLTTTFLVVLPKNKTAEVKKTLRAQEGVSKVVVDEKQQTVVVTFSSDENTVSGLLKVFKSMGITAAAMETGCFGSKEGCINAMKPENTMR
jgi:hypothetical protein